MTFRKGDNVRTNAEWNEGHEPIQGIVTDVKTRRYTKTEEEHDGRGEPISLRFVPGQFEYYTVLCIEGTNEQLAESWFEKVSQ